MFGSNIPAKVYGTQIADQEDQGIDANGQLASDLAPIPPTAFGGPIGAYRAYAEHWAARSQANLPTLRGALASGGRAASERRLGARPGATTCTSAPSMACCPARSMRRSTGCRTCSRATDPGRASPGCTGSSTGCGPGVPPQSLVPWAAQLQRDVVTLRRVLPSVQITPLDYATRSHEILEDAQRDLLSGMDVQWSGAGVLGTAAGLAATQEVIGTLTPLLQGRDNTLAEVKAGCPQLQTVLNRLRKSPTAEPTRRSAS